LDGTCSTYGKKGKLIKVHIGNPEGKRQLERPHLRWAHIKRNCKEPKWKGVDRIYSSG
jgi:hypothetical protein